MNDHLSRRDFLKKTSISAAGASVMSYAPLSAALKTPKEKSKVVIATDEKCFTWPKTVDKPRIQDMIDHTVMTITGVFDKSKAYEALFPEPVTSSTKILIHYNQMKPKTTYVPVQNAIKKGLTSMLDNTFPADNIRIVDREGVANTNEKVTITSSLEFTIKDIWVECDYFINCPICWAINPDIGGITMTFKGMITSVGGPDWGKFHNYTINTDTPWMPILNSHPLFRKKQVLCIVDAITYSLKITNTGSADGATHKIIASKDMVATDYTGLQLLIEKGLPAVNITCAETILDYAANDPYNIGTNDPNNMEVINISPPWTTQIITPGDKTTDKVDINVQTNPAHTIFNQIKASGDRKIVSIYNARGKRIWSHRSSENRILWENNDSNGNKVSSGMYLYRVEIGDIITQGKILVK